MCLHTSKDKQGKCWFCHPTWHSNVPKVDNRLYVPEVDLATQVLAEKY